MTETAKTTVDLTKLDRSLSNLRLRYLAGEILFAIFDTPDRPAKAIDAHDVKAITLGNLSRRNGHALLSNPFGRHTVEWHLWRSGWFEADDHLPPLMHRVVCHNVLTEVPHG